MLGRVYTFLSLLLAVLSPLGQGQITDEILAQEWLDEYNRKAMVARPASVNASWIYNTNITDPNQDKMIEEELRLSDFNFEAAQNASIFAWKNFTGLMHREFFKISDIGTAAMTDPEKKIRLSQTLSDMREIYSTAKVTMDDGRILPLDPDLTRLLATSRNFDELLEAWRKWRDVTGVHMKSHYSEFVELSNEAVRLSGYDDTGDYWRSWYEKPSFAADVEAAYRQLEPLYKHVHAYTRRKLKELYGADKFPASGHIPAHILGNMWAQQWDALLDLLQPFKDKESVDVTDQMKAQNYTALRMFQVSDEFFTSLGLIPMPQEFWDHSMLEKPNDGREVVCHASAWDFYNQKDFRVKQCTDITMAHLITAHHEMGHVEYFLQYKDQPVKFRGGANPGFHEAVGDVISLSVQTPAHLQAIGLLENVEDDPESDINFLMSMALKKIAFLPFGYLMDQWRWSVFSGETPPSQYNDKWWDLRCKYQGIFSSVDRPTESFDPGAKFHIPNNTPYIRYFVSFIYQFQFHEALCRLAGQTGPLHKCDIYNSTLAGTALSDMLKLGSSKQWQDAMEMLTQQREMDAQPLMDYFDPLIKWLEQQNEGQEIGWTEGCPDISPTLDGVTSVHAHGALWVTLIFLSVWRLVF